MDLREESLRLRELATHPPTADARSGVMQALASKHEGVQAVAAEVLGAWGDPESKEASLPQDDSRTLSVAQRGDRIYTRRTPGR